MVSRCTRTWVHASPVQTSHARGGFAGSTPIPWAVASTVSRSADPARDSAKPNSVASPTCTGVEMKHVSALPG